MRLPGLFQRIAGSSPGRWYFAALLPLGIGWFMYALEASEWERLRLREPVQASGEFAGAQCETFRRRGNQRFAMLIEYRFSAPVYANDPVDAMAMKQAPFTARHQVDFSTRELCEAALPEVRQAQAPRPVWYERGQPHSSKTTLEEPDSRRFLWLCLGAMPLATVGVILQWRRRRGS